MLIGERGGKKRFVFPDELRQLRKRQRIFSEARLNGKARAVKAPEEPVLEAGVARFRRHVFYCVPGRFGKFLRQILCAGRVNILTAGVNDAALRVVGEEDIRPDAGCVGRKCRRLTLVEGLLSRKIPRRCAVKAEASL